eukprot:6211496-Pleurochrysis_carterae.AAC.4
MRRMSLIGVRIVWAHGPTLSGDVPWAEAPQKSCVYKLAVRWRARGARGARARRGRVRPRARRTRETAREDVERRRDARTRRRAASVRVYVDTAAWPRRARAEGG